MAGYDDARVLGLDQVERGDPVLPTLVRGLGNEEMDVVVNDVARHDEVECWHVQKGGVNGVGVTGLHRDELGPFEGDGGAIERHRDDDVLGQLVGKARPKVSGDRGGGSRLAHDLDGAGRRDGVRPREPAEQNAETKEVVPMAVGDVDRRQVLPVRFDPVGEVQGLQCRQQRVDQHRVLPPEDEGGRGRRPRRFATEAWRFLRDKGLGRADVHVIPERAGGVRTVGGHRERIPFFLLYA